MSLSTEDPAAVAEAVRAVPRTARAVVVGISGFGGSGKTTLASALHDLLPGSAVVSGDGYLCEQPPTSRSNDWSVMDRDRLRADVSRLAESEDFTVVIAEGLGLFLPALDDLFDLRVWLDVGLDTATSQGMWRDLHVWQNPQTELWLEVWQPNEADFFARFRPDLAADVLYRTRPLSQGRVS